MPPIILEPSRDEELRTRGYTVVRLLEPGEPSHVLQTLHARLGSGFAATDQVAQQFLSHSSFLDTNLHYRRDVHELVRELFQDRLGGILLDYEILIGALFVKQPGTGEVPLHLDWSMVEPPHIGVNVWCPLIDVDYDNGALHLVAGSQHLGSHIAAPRTPLYCSGYAQAVMERSTVVPLKAGEAVIYDSRILHWSPGNRSTKFRPALTITCIPQQARPVFYRLDNETGGSRFEVLDMSNGGFVDQSPADLFEGTLKRPSLGYVPNRNISLSAGEFAKRLDAACGGRPLKRANRAAGVAARLKRMFTAPAV